MLIIYKATASEIFYAFVFRKAYPFSLINTRGTRLWMPQVIS